MQNAEHLSTKEHRTIKEFESGNALAHVHAERVLVEHDAAGPLAEVPRALEVVQVAHAVPQARVCQAQSVRLERLRAVLITVPSLDYSQIV